MGSGRGNLMVRWVIFLLHMWNLSIPKTMMGLTRAKS
jgi:hypothetical protein